MKNYFKNTLKIKDIKKLINQFDDDDNVLIECCLSDDYDNCLKLSEIIDGEPFQIELSNYDLDDDNFVELMFSTKEYKEYNKGGIKNEETK